jgi:hypothetical protein
MLRVAFFTVMLNDVINFNYTKQLILFYDLMSQSLKYIYTRVSIKADSITIKDVALSIITLNAKRRYAVNTPQKVL